MIERTFLEFYESLLSLKAPKGDGFTDNFLPLLPTISSEIKEWLEQSIDISEVEKAIGVFQSGKSPCPDDLCAAFDKK